MFQFNFPEKLQTNIHFFQRGEHQKMLEYSPMSEGEGHGPGQGQVHSENLFWSEYKEIQRSWSNMNQT